MHRPTCQAFQGATLQQGLLPSFSGCILLRGRPRPSKRNGKTGPHPGSRFHVLEPGVLPPPTHTSCPLDGAGDPRLFSALEEWKITGGTMWNAENLWKSILSTFWPCMRLGRPLNKRSIQMNGNIQHAHLFMTLPAWASTASKQAPPGTFVYKIKQLFARCITISVPPKEHNFWHRIWKRKPEMSQDTAQ